MKIIRAGHLSPGGAEPPRVDASQWGSVIEAAERHNMPWLLYASAKTLGLDSHMAADAHERLAGYYLYAHFANRQAYQELAALRTVLAASGIVGVLLKGGALAMTLYNDVGERAFIDLDILIPPETADRVIASLQAQGYVHTTEPLASGIRREFVSEQVFRHTSRRQTVVDIHWDLLNMAYYRRPDLFDWFWRHTREAEIDGQLVRILDVDAELLHLCAHFVLHHRGMELNRSYDIALALTRHAANLDWTSIVSAARRLNLVLVLRRALADVSACWEVDAPVWVSKKLEGYSVGTAERIVSRIYSSSGVALSPLVDWWYLRGIRAKLLFIVDRSFPPRMVAKPRGSLTAYVSFLLQRIRHLCDVALSMAKAAVSLVREA